MQGKVVRTWESKYVPGQEAYLLENSHLLRPATLGDNEKAALNLGVGMSMSGVIEDGMKGMSEKFAAMGEKLYLDADKVKESNRVL